MRYFIDAGEGTNLLSGCYQLCLPSAHLLAMFVQTAQIQFACLSGSLLQCNGQVCVLQKAQRSTNNS